MGHRATLHMNEAQWMQIDDESAKDPIMSQLCTTIFDGWPEKQNALPDSLKPYFDVRDQLTMQDNIVFKGQRLVIPPSLWKELMDVIHAMHIGIE